MHSKIFVVSLFGLFSLALCELDKTLPGILEVGPSRVATKEVSPRVSVEASNLPASLQVAAADSLKVAYELHDTDSGRIELFASLFTEIYPTYQWNVVLDYQHVYYIGAYYIRLRVDNGDVVFVFSSNN